MTPCSLNVKQFHPLQFFVPLPVQVAMPHDDVCDVIISCATTKSACTAHRQKPQVLRCTPTKKRHNGYIRAPTRLAVLCGVVAMYVPHRYSPLSVHIPPASDALAGPTRTAERIPSMPSRHTGLHAKHIYTHSPANDKPSNCSRFHAAAPWGEGGGKRWHSLAHAAPTGLVSCSGVACDVCAPGGRKIGCACSIGGELPRWKQKTHKEIEGCRGTPVRPHTRAGPQQAQGTPTRVCSIESRCELSYNAA